MADETGAGQSISLKIDLVNSNDSYMTFFLTLAVVAGHERGSVEAASASWLRLER